MEYQEWGTPNTFSECTSAVVAFAGKRLIACIEDSRLTRSKTNLHNSKAREWVLARSRELGFSDNDVTVLCCDGLTNEENIAFNKEHPNLYGVSRGHHLAKIHRNHHLKHAYNAYYQSGYTDALIIVMDGCDYPGGTSIAIFEGKGKDVKIVAYFDTTKSPGMWYAYGCVSCGFKWFHPGKLMAASSFSAVPYAAKIMAVADSSVGTMFPCTFEMLPYKYTSPALFIEHTKEFNSLMGIDKGIPARPEFFDFRLVERAAVFQHFYNISVFKILDYASYLVSSQNLVIGGGCASNVVTTGELIRSGLWDNIFVPPLHDDAGNAIGAAIIRGGIELSEPLVYNRHTYKKPSEWSVEISPSELAKKIEEGQIVAWFEGGSEYGPRALCHRSILANPCIPYIAYRLNEIKNREYWRPFAPVVLDTHFKKIFFVEGRIWEPHKYMLATEYIRTSYFNKYKNICAPNGSSRPQVLVEGNKHNEVLYSLMKDNGLPILINTSMNGRGEPICETPEDAIQFASKHKDVMLVFVQNNKIYCKAR